MPQFQLEYVDPAALNPAPWNPRKIDTDALKRLATLLDEHGFVDPVIVRRSDRLIIGGHQRLTANRIRSKPDRKVPCIFLDGVTDARAKALNIALNSEQAQGRDDDDKLGVILEELKAAEIDLPATTGMSDERIADVLVDPVDFEPDETEASRLDQQGTKKVTCPSCGYEF